MYAVEFIESARKDFMRLGSGDQKRVIAVLGRIRVRPHSFALRLSGSKAYRVRAGDLRIIIDIEEKRIVVLKIGNRESVYRS